MLKYIFSVFIVLILCNRCLFAFEEYKRLTLEHATDLYMFQVCLQVDYKKIGRHAIVCSDLEKRLSSSVWFHVAKSVVNDTLYQEATLYGIVQLALVLMLVLVGNGIHTRYIKQRDHQLPTINKAIKYD